LFLSYALCPPNAWESDLALSRSGLSGTRSVRMAGPGAVWRSTTETEFLVFDRSVCFFLMFSALPMPGKAIWRCPVAVIGYPCYYVSSLQAGYGHLPSRVRISSASIVFFGVFAFFLRHPLSARFASRCMHDSEFTRPC
jgi:hypothetical protein